MSTEIERRSYELQEIQFDTRAENAPVIRGHAAVFNGLSENLGGFRETIAPGAFAEAIERDDVRALLNHDPSIVLGRNTAGTLRLSEDETGLAIEIDPPDTQAGRDLLVSLERRDITQMSFGFSVMPGGQDWAEDDDGMTIRTLTSLRLFDVSPVAFPAYPQTDIAAREYRDYLEHRTPVLWSAKLRLRELHLLETEF